MIAVGHATALLCSSSVSHCTVVAVRPAHHGLVDVWILQRDFLSYVGLRTGKATTCGDAGYLS